MKKITLIIGVSLTGCISQQPTMPDFKPLPPEPLIKRNLVEKTIELPPEELKKGPESPGRVIDYKGHGLGYSGHANHHYHMRHTHR